MNRSIPPFFRQPRFVGAILNSLFVLFPRKTEKITLGLLRTPQKGRKFTAEDEAFLQTAEAETLELDDFLLQTYRWPGKRRKVLLAHGWDSNAARWRKLITYLQKNEIEVVALDAPAMGRSGNRTVDAVLYARAIAMAINRFNPDTLVGHSFGGSAAVYYLAQLSGECPINRLVLMGTPSRLTTMLKGYYQLLGLRSALQRSTEKSLEQVLGHPLDYFSAHRLIRKISIPGLIIHDEKDSVAPVAEARLIHENWPVAKLYITHGIGHSLQAEEVYAMIQEQLSA